MGNFTFFADRPVEKYRRTDKGLLVSILLLWGLGIFTLYICSPNTGLRLFNEKYYFVERQLISSAIGFAGLLFFAFVPMDKIRKILPYIVIGTFLLCFATLLPGIGVEKKGARRWIRIPFLSTFQPSEAAKMMVILFLANWFTKQNELPDSSERKILPAIIGLVGFVIVIIVAQKDFSTGAFIFVIGLTIFFVSGEKLIWIVPFALLAVPACILLISMEPYRIRRVAAFFNPSEFTKTSGYQLFASKRAISSGGFWGSGFGSGLSKINSIPEVQTDYIFAGWAESTGFVGVIAYFAALVFFAKCSFKVAFTTPNMFAAYGTFGCALSIVAQSILNCAVVCGAIPTTGIPLPFFSSGGSSIIMTLCMCGFMLNASHCSAQEEVENVNKYENVDINNLDGVVIENE